MASTMISLDLRSELYNIIKSKVLPKIRYEGTDLMNVISSIWNVYKRPATEDSRYHNLGDEIDKHYFLNDDWNEDKVFIGKLHVLDDEHNFIRFLEGLLNAYKEYNVDAYLVLKGELEPLLDRENIHIQEDKDDNQRIRAIRLIVGDVNASRVEDRSLKFYVCDSIITNVVNFSEQSIDFPDDSNCFVLTFDSGWDDFGLHTRYHLYYIHDGHVNPIEEVKIMKRGERNTGNVLPSSFYSLSNDFCSLGQNERYYERMRSYFGDKATIYLSELRDAAVFTSIQKSFELDDYFKTSLLRYNSAEQMLRLGIFILNERDPSYAFGFEYKYHPEYNKLSETKLHFGFFSKCLSYQRTYALIGENGVGKTTLMVDLIKDIVMTNKDGRERHFDNIPPLFSCVIAITYSPFDTYPLNGNKDFNSSLIAYEYNGLFKEKDVLLSIDERVDAIKEGIERIWGRRQKINEVWVRKIEKVFNPDLIKTIFKSFSVGKCEVDRDALKGIYLNASSGEAIYLSIITAILSKIRFESILFLDEPEQHLHPTGINLLMSTINELLEEFDSFAIISTHSPYILREVPSSNVMIFHRYGNNLSVTPIGIETFGEDVSVISDIVFDNRSQNKIFESYIERVVEDEGYDYDKAISVLRNNDKEPSLNTKMIIMSLIENKKQ